MTELQNRGIAVRCYISDLLLLYFPYTLTISTTEARGGVEASSTNHELVQKTQQSLAQSRPSIKVS